MLEQYMRVSKINEKMDPVFFSTRTNNAIWLIEQTRKLQDFRMINWPPARGTWLTCSHVSHVHSAVDCFCWNEFSRARYPWHPDWLTKKMLNYFCVNAATSFFSHVWVQLFQQIDYTIKSNFHEISSLSDPKVSSILYLGFSFHEFQRLQLTYYLLFICAQTWNDLVLVWGVSRKLMTSHT